LNSTRDIDALIDMMARLPGLGPRSARRAGGHKKPHPPRLPHPLKQKKT
jgi:recombinational DNA repair protein RecR